MKQIVIIAKRELNSFFDSIMAYLIIIFFLGFSGALTWLFGNGDVFFIGEASMQSFFGVAYWALFFFAPALSMRLLAEEKRSGTIELILTKPVSDWQLILGKFLATMALIFITLVLTMVYYISIAKMGPVDHGAVWAGYLGLFLMSSAYVSIGIFASSLTNNQIIAFLLALLINFLFHMIFGWLAGSFPGIIGDLLSYLSVSGHYESMARGVIDSKDLIYFATIIFLGMYFSEVVLSKRNLTDK